MMPSGLKTPWFLVYLSVALCTVPWMHFLFCCYIGPATASLVVTLVHPKHFYYCWNILHIFQCSRQDFRGSYNNFCESSKACDTQQDRDQVTPPPKRTHKPGAGYLEDLIFKNTQKQTAPADTYVKGFLFQLPLFSILLVLFSSYCTLVN